MTTSLHAELQALRPSLVRFALLQLRNEALAEDAVQDTLIAVLERPDGYAGRSSLRTYVTGILKHKVIDVLHAGKREVSLAGDDEVADTEVIDALFKPDGHTVELPRDWGSPHATLEQKDFFRVMELCLEKLPARTARIFLMREWLEFDTAEICRELAITPSNAWVMLYRARVQLRECLDLNWFGR